MEIQPGDVAVITGADSGLGEGLAGVRSRIYEAERNRPEALGGPAPASAEQWEGMEPREIGLLLLDAVREDRLFVFTETWPRRFIGRRHARMMAAFDVLDS